MRPEEQVRWMLNFHIACLCPDDSRGFLTPEQLTAIGGATALAWVLQSWQGEVVFCDALKRAVRLARHLGLELPALPLGTLTPSDPPEDALPNGREGGENGR